MGLLSVISIVAVLYLWGFTVPCYIQFGTAIFFFTITFCLFLFLRRANLMIKGDYDSPSEKKKDEILAISAALWNAARLVINQIFNSIPQKYSELSIIFMCIKPDHLAVNTVKADVNKGARFLNFISCIFGNNYKQDK